MFYDKFKQLCDAKGVSCNKAALEIGLSNATPTKWKKTGATPDSATLAKVSKYFGVPIAYLLGETDDPFDKTKTHWAEVIYKNEKPALVSEDGQTCNIIKIAGRDGSYVEKRLGDKELQALKAFVDLLPDAGEDL